MTDTPYLVALNLTRRCNLACAHCYLDAGTRSGGEAAELNTKEVEAILDDIAALSDETMVVLTGGEPLMRPDIDDLARHATNLGLMVVVGSNGTLLDEARAERLMAAGVRGVGISLDSLNPRTHDAFRGVEGAWARAMTAIDSCRRVGLGVQVHFSVTDDTADEFDDMVAFAKAAGAIALNVFFLVCTGRGEKVTNISLETYERLLERLCRAAHDSQGMMIRAKCAPHFKRMALQLDPAWPVTSAHGYEAGGCMAATRYCRVTPEGEVTPCPYMERSAGSLRERSFAEIWANSPLLATLRAPELEGRCGACEYGKVCGGCRARPLARDGNLMGEDFLCGYQPKGGAVIEPMADTGDSIPWDEDAEGRLKKMPPFVRKLVRRRAEEYVRSGGRTRVTAEDISALARQRFGSAEPPKFLATRLARALRGPR